MHQSNFKCGNFNETRRKLFVGRLTSSVQSATLPPFFDFPPCLSAPENEAQPPSKNALKHLSRGNIPNKCTGPTRLYLDFFQLHSFLNFGVVSTSGIFLDRLRFEFWRENVVLGRSLCTNNWRFRHLNVFCQCN